jgi:hypothetical protein
MCVVKNDWLASTADRKLRARVDRPADFCNQRLLSPESQAEHNSSARFGRFVAILNSKARRGLDNRDSGSARRLNLCSMPAGVSL